MGVKTAIHCLRMGKRQDSYEQYLEMEDKRLNQAQR